MGPEPAFDLGAGSLDVCLAVRNSEQLPVADVPVTAQLPSPENVSVPEVLQRQLTSALVEMLLRQTPVLA